MKQEKHEIRCSEIEKRLGKCRFFEKSYKNTRTIKAPDFDKKSGAFLTFWRKMGRSKMPWGIAAGIVPKNAFSENREF